MAAFRTRGDKIIDHRRRHSERQSVLAAADEAAPTAEVPAIPQTAEGTAPKSWLSKWIAETHYKPGLLTQAAW